MNMEKNIRLFCVILLIALIAAAYAENRPRKKDIPASYFGVTLGQDITRVTQSLLDRNIDIVSNTVRLANGYTWFRLAPPLTQNPELPVNQERPRLKEYIPRVYSWNSQNSLVGSEARFKKQRVLVAVQFMGKRTRLRYVHYRRKPLREFINYVVYSFYFNSNLRLYQITADYSRLELMSADQNYLYHDLSDPKKFGRADKYQAVQVARGQNMIHRILYTWFSNDYTRRMEAYVTMEVKPDALNEYRPMYVSLIDVKESEELLNRKSFDDKKTRKFFDTLTPGSDADVPKETRPPEKK